MSECNVTIGVDVVDLGSEINKRIRFSTENTPEAIQCVYGTVAATTPEAIPMGQVAASLVDMMYIKAIDYDMYVSPVTIVSTGANLKIAAGEACVFRPYDASGVLSVGIWSATAEANYECLIVGQSS
jgi:hypothetical protein